MVWQAIIAAAGSVYSSNQAANAQQQGIDAANAQITRSGRQTTAATAQGLELARPLVQTRDSALNALQVLFGLPQTQPSQINAPPGSPGSNLVPLAGVRTVLQAGKKDKTGPIDFLGAFTQRGSQEVSSPVYYDPSRDAFVDDAGIVVAQRGQGGQIEGLRHGTDNLIRIGPNGEIISVGNKGEVNIGQLPAAQQQQAQAGASAQSQITRQGLIDNLLNTPGVQFVNDEGRRDLERALSARGFLQSGPGFRAGIDRAANQAAANFGNLVLNPLFQLAGFGNTGTGLAINASQFGTQANQATSSQLADLSLRRGDARASSFLNRGQIANDLASNLAFLYERRQPGQQQQQRPASLPTDRADDFDSQLYDAIYGGR